MKAAKGISTSTTLRIGTDNDDVIRVMGNKFNIYKNSKIEHQERWLLVSGSMVSTYSAENLVLNNRHLEESLKNLVSNYGDEIPFNRIYLMDATNQLALLSKDDGYSFQDIKCHASN